MDPAHYIILLYKHAHASNNMVWRGVYVFTVK